MTRPVLRVRDLRAGRSWRRAAPVLGLALSVGVLAAVWAAPSSPASEAPFLSENSAAMARMMHRMTIKPSGDVDKDFVAMMVPHHQGAIDMAMAVLRYGRNEKIRRLAQEIIITQQQEVVAMRLAVGERLPAAAMPTPRLPSVTQDAVQPHRGLERHGMN